MFLIIPAMSPHAVLVPRLCASCWPAAGSSMLAYLLERALASSAALPDLHGLHMRRLPSKWESNSRQIRVICPCNRTHATLQMQAGQDKQRQPGQPPSLVPKRTAPPSPQQG